MGGHRRALAAASLLALLAPLGYIALDAGEEAGAVARDVPPRELYARTDRCPSACAALASTSTFEVGDDVRQVELMVYAALEPESGPARLTVIDPSGDVRFDEIFSGAAERLAREETASWASEVGEWTIARSYAGTIGRLDVQLWGALLG